MPIELVIFDCDGTLTDSEIIIGAEEVAALKPYGIEMEVPEFLRRFAARPEADVLAELETEAGRALPDDVFKSADARIDERLWRELKVIDGVHDALDRLDQPRCICSNSRDTRLKMELQRTELWDRFRPYVFSARDLEGVTPKPAPDVFLHAAREFEVSPGECVVVEDSAAGVTAGVAAGMRVVGFTGGSHSWTGHADTLTEAGAETVIHRMADLPALVEAMSVWSPDA